MLSAANNRLTIALTLSCALAIWPTSIVAQNQRESTNFTVGASQQSAVLGDELIRLNDRLSALERLVSQLVAQNDQFQYETNELLAQLERFKVDAEARMADVEAHMANSPSTSGSGSAINPTAPQMETSQRARQELDPYAEAMKYVDEQNWLNAEIALDAFLASAPSDPKVPRARYELGRAYLGQGQPAQAARVFLDLFESGDASAFGAENLFALARALEQLDEVNGAQICSVFNEIESSYSEQLNPENRQTILEKKLQYSCS